MMIPITNKQPVFFRPGTDKPVLVTRTRSMESRTGQGEFLLCRQCLAAVTTVSEKIDVNGFHRHSFTNPHGLFFDVGCFRNAPGCAYSSDSSYEFTWFNGFSWQVAVCRICMAHLGWLFTSSGSRFNGLILDSLVVSDSSGATHS